MLSLESKYNEYDIMNVDNTLIRETPELMKILLMDRTTRRNIIWATDSYTVLGKEFFPEEPIKLNLVANGASELLKPRAAKLKHDQEARTRDRAEVFTPTWVIKKQNDLVEKEFKDLPLEEYINKTWLEITCGEGPYMASRYDTVTGEALAIKDRVGFVDRKLQRISAEVTDQEEWLNLVYKAYQASFGYEFQGDSLLIARENLLYTFIDYYLKKFDAMPDMKEVEEIAKIISYNVFQMDGLNYTIPLSEEVELRNLGTQLSLFGDTGEEETVTELIKEGIYVKIKNWENSRLIKFRSIVEEEGV